MEDAALPTVALQLARLSVWASFRRLSIATVLFHALGSLRSQLAGHAKTISSSSSGSWVSFASYFPLSALPDDRGDTALRGDSRTPLRQYNVGSNIMRWHGDRLLAYACRVAS